MASLPSGSRDDVEFIKIDATEFSLVINPDQSHGARNATSA